MSCGSLIGERKKPQLTLSSSTGDNHPPSSLHRMKFRIQQQSYKLLRNKRNAPTQCQFRLDCTWQMDLTEAFLTNSQMSAQKLDHLAQYLSSSGRSFLAELCFYLSHAPTKYKQCKTLTCNILWQTICIEGRQFLVLQVCPPPSWQPNQQPFINEWQHCNTLKQFISEKTSMSEEGFLFSFTTTDSGA